MPTNKNMKMQNGKHVYYGDKFGEMFTPEYALVS